MCYTIAILSLYLTERRICMPTKEGQLSFYTINEVADMLGVSRVTVARWCNSGEIPAYRLGRKWKINKAEFDAWLQERKNAKED